MKKLTLFLFLLGTIVTANAQDIPSYSFEELEDRINAESKNQPLVVNFWATWCAPCIKELPHFESLRKDYQADEIKVLLVSLDMDKDKALKFKEKKQLQSDVAYLDEVDFNQWIDKISPDWSGAIPATLMISPSGDRSFHEGEFSKEELYEQVKRFFNKTN
ncbi:TlpA disulfide reductase family protein [Catalinimonas sp. 4WD22]|uniref:TlpA family protein disulfide reductase n=1 Tax=Catalinimonas locisalis TaxID=3133978 RepID=UPI0031011F58